MQLTYDYAGPSALIQNAHAADLALSVNRRRPVKFHGRVRSNVYQLRLALQTLGELVWSEFQWMDNEEYDRFMESVLDPVITVHDDRVFFEAFNQDMSAYGLVIVDRELFEAEGDVQTGTTNIDFTKGLWTSLDSMRSTGDTWFRVGPQGFQVQTGEATHVEAKVDIPTPWVEGFLQLQSAMAMPGTRVSMQPVDVLNIIEYLRTNNAFTSPRSLRFEFEPGKDAAVVLEPWEHRINLEGASHNYAEHKTTRIWGRRRLALIENLLPHAESVDLYLKGRALPSFWAVNLKGITFVLGASGWTGNNWTKGAAFDQLVAPSPGEAAVGATLAELRRELVATTDSLAECTGMSVRDARRALNEACRRGLCIYDVTKREFRHRELFETPIDPDVFFEPNQTRLAAVQLVEDGLVQVTSRTSRETRKPGGVDPMTGENTFTVHHDDVIDGVVDGQTTHVVLKADGSIIFGRCTCEFFDNNLMNLGPCEHMLALVTEPLTNAGGEISTSW